MEITFHFVHFPDIEPGSGKEQEVVDEMDRFAPRRMWATNRQVVYNFKTPLAAETAINEVWLMCGVKGVMKSVKVVFE